MTLLVGKCKVCLHRNNSMYPFIKNWCLNGVSRCRNQLAFKENGYVGQSSPILSKLGYKTEFKTLKKKVQRLLMHACTQTQCITTRLVA